MPATSAIYDSIGGGYDNTRRADPDLAQRLIGHLQPHAGGRYLDLACGTGNYTRVLAESGLRMTGVDISKRMLAEARGKSAGVDWHLGDVADLPFANGVFDGAVCTLATHHFPELDTAFREVFRVMRSGRFVIFTTTPEQTRDYWLNAYFPVTLRQAATVLPTYECTAAALSAAGFAHIAQAPFFVTPELRDHFLYSGKQRPAIYLDPQVRAGTSAFARYGSPAEIARGCTALLDDLNAGRFDDVAAQYDGALGDYLFIVAEKP